VRKSEALQSGRLWPGAPPRRGRGGAGDDFEGVDAAAHQVFERDAASELVVEGGGDFFVAACAQGYGAPRWAGGGAAGERTRRVLVRRLAETVFKVRECEARSPAREGACAPQ